MGMSIFAFIINGKNNFTTKKTNDSPYHCKALECAGSGRSSRVEAG